MSIDDQLLESLSQPRSVAVDGVSTTTHALSEVLEAVKYMKRSQAASSPTFGLKFAKLIPPGSISQ